MPSTEEQIKLRKVLTSRAQRQHQFSPRTEGFRDHSEGKTFISEAPMATRDGIQGSRAMKVTSKVTGACLFEDSKGG